MITNKMKIQDTFERFEYDIYKYYPNLLKESISNINNYIDHLQKQIKSISYSLNLNVFPVVHPRWINMHQFKENEMKNIIINKFINDGENVFFIKYLPKDLVWQKDIIKTIKEAENWLSRWIEIKEVLTERLQIIDKLPLPPFQTIDEEQIVKPQLEEIKPVTQPIITVINGLKKPDSGELIELCFKYSESFNLKKGKTVKKEIIQSIYDKITNEEKIKTTCPSIASTFRKLGFCKKNDH